MEHAMRLIILHLSDIHFRENGNPISSRVNAIASALDDGGKAFYTTPLKALSNQKFGDLSREHGPRRVGLLTGDNSINGNAPVVVMTTEVLRNMIYAQSPTLAGLRYVVLDEVHYLQNRYRGAVWEEVIIHLPESVRVVALSATVSNAEEFGEWLDQVRREIDRSIGEHVRAARLNPSLRTADELKLALEFLRFHLSNRVLYCAVWLRGPLAAGNLVRHSTGLARELKGLLESFQFARSVAVEVIREDSKRSVAS